LFYPKILVGTVIKGQFSSSLKDLTTGWCPKILPAVGVAFASFVIDRSGVIMGADVSGEARPRSNGQ